MRIAQIAPLNESVPPEKYGGTELVVHNLTEELVKRGHDVTLFASGDSKTSAKLISVVEKNLRSQNLDQNDFIYTFLNILKIIENSKNFEIIHHHLNSQADYLFLPLADYLNLPVISTTHFQHPVAKEKKILMSILKKYSQHPIISISFSQRKIKGLNYIANIYHGIDISEFDFNPTPKDYLFWLGRFCQEKGAAEAIRLAKTAKQKIILAGKIDGDPSPDREYFYQKILPEIDQKQIIYIGEIGPSKKNYYLKNAQALINLVHWDEPFGLVAIEALACGTPVVASPRGAMPEIIEHKKTGFLVKNQNQAMAAVKNICDINRADCRKTAEKKFSAAKMAEEYEKIFKRFLKNKDKRCPRNLLRNLSKKTIIK